jgi:hypothetical protein
MARKRNPEAQKGSTDAPVEPVTAATAFVVAVLESEGGPTAESIRRRAHEVYERRQAMGLPGDDEGDWLQAEAELVSEAQART